MLLRETGLIYEEKLKDPTTAFAKFLEAFSLAPTREITREDVARLAGHVEGGWDKLIKAYEEAIDRRQPIRSRSPTCALSAGTVLAQIGRVDEAIKQLADVYDAEPDNMRAAQALEPLYRQTGRFADVLEIYRKRQDSRTNPSVRTRARVSHRGAHRERAQEARRGDRLLHADHRRLGRRRSRRLPRARASVQDRGQVHQELGRHAAASHRPRADLGRGAGFAQVPARARQAGAPRRHGRGGRAVPRDSLARCRSTRALASSSRALLDDDEARQGGGRDPRADVRDLGPVGEADPRARGARARARTSPRSSSVCSPR